MKHFSFQLAVVVSAWITWTFTCVTFEATPTRRLQCLCWWKTKCWEVCGSWLVGRRVMVFSARAGPPVTCMPWISHASSSSPRSKVGGCAVFHDLPSSHLHRWEMFLKCCTYEDVKELLEFLSVNMMEWWQVCFFPRAITLWRKGLAFWASEQTTSSWWTWMMGKLKFITKA